MDFYEFATIQWTFYLQPGGTEKNQWSNRNKFEKSPAFMDLIFILNFFGFLKVILKHMK